MDQRLQQLSPDRYTVGWLCALPKSELAAAVKMLDHRHKPAFLENMNDENVYRYGDINGHNVVLACLAPGNPGKLSAQRLVRPLKQSFPNMRLHLFVGIGGGVPRRPPRDEPKEDIHLGDVVVGWAERTNVPSIVQYNRVNRLSNGRYSAPGSLARPSDQLLQALGQIITDDTLDQAQYDSHLVRLKKVSGFEHPGLQNDVLFENAYPHDNKLDPDTCNHCDISRCVNRPRRESERMVFHQGTILSDDFVMEDPEERDRLSELYYDAICFETEAAGVMEDTRCLVIRGIADYADSHKNHVWQKYAAGTAAAFAREILYNIQPLSNSAPGPAPDHGRLTGESIYSFSTVNSDLQPGRQLTSQNSSATPNFEEAMANKFQSV